MHTIPIAKALVLDSASNMLVLRRSKTHDRLALKPDLPGGQTNEGEDFGAALVREILEETGLTVTLAELSPLYSGTEIFEGENRVRVFYVARLQGEKPDVKISWEHDNAEWWSPERLAELIDAFDFHPFYHAALSHIKANNLI